MRTTKLDSSAISIRLTKELKNRIRPLRIETLSQHDTLLALLRLGVEIAEADPTKRALSSAHRANRMDRTAQDLEKELGSIE